MRMHLLFSHRLSSEQVAEARERFSIEEFVPLPAPLQKLWSEAPPERSSLREYLEPLFGYLRLHLREGEYALVQGEAGMSCLTVQYLWRLGGIPLYATSYREAEERRVGEALVKRSIFRHVRFREYETLQ